MMRKLVAFNNVSLDGYFTDSKGDMSWAHRRPDDAEWNAFTAENAKEVAAKFNEWGSKCAAAGLKFTYHAHGYEFRPYQDGTVFDLLVAETKPEFVNFELDIFWAFDAGADPVSAMDQQPSSPSQRGPAFACCEWAAAPAAKTNAAAPAARRIKMCMAVVLERVGPVPPCAT